GFPGERSRFFATLGGIHSQSLPWLATEAERPATCPWFDPAIHIAVEYPAFGRDERGQTDNLPSANGLSGSALWKTNVHTRGEAWKVDDIELVGVMTDWDTGSRKLIGVRIEYVWTLLLHVLQLEHAYFRWLDRGRTHGDDWSDWFAGQRFIES